MIWSRGDRTPASLPREAHVAQFLNCMIHCNGLKRVMK